MSIEDEKIKEAVYRTEVLRPPKQTLDTFGITSTFYYIVTEPAYSEIFEDEGSETVIREGRVIAQRPRVVTPYYLKRLEGFSSNAKKYFDALVREQGSNSPGLMYDYKNEPKEMTIVQNKLESVVDQINKQIDESGDPLTTIIKGEDEFWDVSLLKFIYELTAHSILGNVKQLSDRGLLGVGMDGVPVEARLRIEEMFSAVIKGDAEPENLRDELERWSLFAEYQDRFLNIFKKKWK